MSPQHKITSRIFKVLRFFLFVCVCVCILISFIISLQEHEWGLIQRSVGTLPKVSSLFTASLENLEDFPHGENRIGNSSLMSLWHGINRAGLRSCCPSAKVVCTSCLCTTSLYGHWFVFIIDAIYSMPGLRLTMIILLNTRMSRFIMPVLIDIWDEHVHNVCLSWYQDEQIHNACLY